MKKNIILFVIISVFMLVLSRSNYVYGVTADFASTAPKCTGYSVDFINLGSTGGTCTYSWNFGSGATPATSILENPTGIVYSSSGIKFVEFIITDGLLADTIIKTININQSPTVTFNSTTPECEGTGVDFTNTGSTGGSWIYSWDFGSGAFPITSTAENRSGVIYSTYGTKTITFTISDGTCTETTTNTITILETPVVDFSSTAPQCTGLDVDFTNTSSTGGSWTYLWNFGSGATPATSALENPASVVYSTGGTKLVKLIVSDGTCNDSLTKTININLTPTVSFSATEPECAGTGVDFTNTGSTGSNWSYFWDLGQDAIPATATTENPVGVLYSSDGTKTISFTISDGNCTETFTNTITINESPVANFASTTPQCTGLDVDFTNTGSTGGSWTYLWNFGSGATPATSTLENPVAIVYSTDGTKLVKVGSKNSFFQDKS